jgi:ankyrin repeat protein
MSRLKLLRKIIKIFVVGFVGLTFLSWVETKVGGYQSTDANEYGYEIVGLISNKDTVNNKNDQGETALHLAVKSKNQELIKVLIDKGADIEASTNIKATPLHYAASFANAEIINLLVERGANVNALDNNNELPIDWATKMKKTGNVKLLKSLLPQNITQK